MTTPLRPLKILLVEDSPTLRHVLTGDIRHAGHEVIIAQSGEEALQIVESTAVDMILMDVEMPGLDGFETTRLIREMLFNHWIPIIFVTGKDNDEDLAQGIDAGGDDYLIKPVRRVILQAKIRAMERIIAIRDQLRHVNEELRDLSERDSLTKLFNRRVFQDRAEERWKQSVRSHEPLAILLLDIDHFKAYNDCYGHVAGDDCISQVANAIGRCVNRPGDVLARYGGEEFIALLHNTGEAGAWHVAESIRESVTALRIPHQDSQTADFVTVSIGGSVIHITAGTTLLGQISSADKLLYSAKQNGRNRSVIKTFNPQNTLLVVDAHGGIVDAVDRALHGQFSLLSANNVEAALAQIQENQPDIIVLDAQLGGNNALRLVQKLRTHAETAQIPILWVTEYASDFVSLSHNQNYRIDGFINKPIDGNKLVAKVDSLLT